MPNRGKDFWTTIWMFFQIIVFGLQLFIAVGFFYLWSIKNQLNNPAVLAEAKAILASPDLYPDASNVLTYALQLGRLDFVSMGLTLLGVVIAIFGFAGFWILRREVIDTCKNETVKYLKSEACNEMIIQYLRSTEGVEAIDQSVIAYISDYKERYTMSISDENDGSFYDTLAESWDNEVDRGQ